jgi:hypothetical protein
MHTQGFSNDFNHNQKKRRNTMKGSRILVGLLLGLLLILAIGSGLAQEPEAQTQPQGSLAIHDVSSMINYQGRLLNDGVPVSTLQDMIFRLYAEETCTNQFGGDIPANDVPLEDGFFSVDIPVTHSLFNGQEVWLEIEVEGTVLGCHELLPAPYALSLRPGAQISSELVGEEVLYVRNTATSGYSYGVYGRSQSTSGSGVGGIAGATSGQAYGLYGRSSSPEGAGVYARGEGDNADLVLASSSASNDNGVISTDPGQPGSDLFFYSNDRALIHLDEDNSSSGEYFGIFNGTNTSVFAVFDDGDVLYGGPGVAAFPQPAYDSGWVSVGQGDSVVLTHSLGGDPDNYVVDLNFKSGTNQNVQSFGGAYFDGSFQANDGAYWDDLNNSTITVNRLSEDWSAGQCRIRIWVYP